MYEVRKHYLMGYVIFPCFRVRLLDGTDDAEMICGKFTQFIFEHFFAIFWNGKIHITGDYYEPTQSELKVYIETHAIEGDLFPDLR